MVATVFAVYENKLLFFALMPAIYAVEKWVRVINPCVLETWKLREEEAVGDRGSRNSGISPGAGVALYQGGTVVHPGAIPPEALDDAGRGYAKRRRLQESDES